MKGRWAIGEEVASKDVPNLVLPDDDGAGGRRCRGRYLQLVKLPMTEIRPSSVDLKVHDGGVYWGSKGVRFVTANPSCL